MPDSIPVLSPREQARYNAELIHRALILLFRGLTGLFRAAIQYLMTAKDDTKQVMWLLLILLQTIILTLSGWCLSYTVATGERVARLETKIDFLTNGGRAESVFTNAPPDTFALLSAPSIPPQSVE